MTDDLSRAEIEAMAKAMLERHGFGFYLDPTEGGQDAYDLSLEAIEAATAAHAAASRVREERGFVVVPGHPTEAMRKAWITAAWKPEFLTGADELVPEFGTGQGDLRMVPEWENEWITMKYSKCYRAMLAASQQRTADNV